MLVAVVIVVVLADEPVIKPLAGPLHTLSARHCGGRRIVRAQHSPVLGGLWRTHGVRHRHSASGQAAKTRLPSTPAVLILIAQAAWLRVVGI
ncbi:MAG: hypothetical protein AAB676_11960, partial [Verrucomicrobiota bacterium]